MFIVTIFFLQMVFHVQFLDCSFVYLERGSCSYTLDGFFSFKVLAQTASDSWPHKQERLPGKLVCHQAVGLGSSYRTFLGSETGKKRKDLSETQ